MILSSATCDQLIEWSEGGWYFAALELPSGGCVCGRGKTLEASHEKLRVGLENLAEGPIRMLAQDVLPLVVEGYSSQAIFIGVMPGDPATYACTPDFDGNLVWGRGDTPAEAGISLLKELGSIT